MRALTILAIGGLLVACGGDDQAEPAKPELIAYQASGGGPEQVIVARVDGTEHTAPAVDAPGSNQTNPDWSPDGERLVFAVTNGTRDSLWTVDRDGSGAAELLECVDTCLYLDDPAWSPDGSSIVYARTTGDGPRRGSLETVDMSGNVTVVLAGSTTEFYAGPRWSPDGTSLVVEVVDSPDGETAAGITLSVVDLTTSPPTVRPLTEPDLFAGTADWSPDGELIAYAALPEAGEELADLFIIRPDGSGETRVTNLGVTGGEAVHPSFTIDGKRLVFAALLPDVSDDYVLATVTLTGEDLRPAIGDDYVTGVHPRTRPT